MNKKHLSHLASAILILMLVSCNNQDINESYERPDLAVHDHKAPDSLTSSETESIINNPPIFTCGGNEPFWSIIINDTNIRLYVLALEKELIFTNFKHLTENNKHTYKEDSKDGKIILEIEDKYCEDDMSGEPFEYAVTIKTNENTYSGCCKCINN